MIGPSFPTTLLFALFIGMFPNAAVSHQYLPIFHPERLKGPPAGKPNEVLVLGTPHLSSLPDSVRPETLTPLIDRLARWKPTGIAVERLQGMQCDTLRRYPARYASTVKAYCYDTSIAGAATGLDVPAATAEVERILGAWPAHPTPGERRHLAAIFMAAGEPPSALVQWLRLDPAERYSSGDLTPALTSELDKLRLRRNEVYLIAAALAARLGHERLWNMDDHSSDLPNPSDAKAANDAIARAWDNPISKLRLAEDKRLTANLDRPGGVLALYRAANDRRAPMLAYKSDIGAALVEPSAQAFGRSYVGFWETRNLRMVSNIREVLELNPGSRLLVIVGASHKGYFEAYLNQMHDLMLVSSDAVLS